MKNRVESPTSFVDNRTSIVRGVGVDRVLYACNVGHMIVVSECTKRIRSIVSRMVPTTKVDPLHRY